MQEFLMLLAAKFDISIHYNDLGNVYYITVADNVKDIKCRQMISLAQIETDPQSVQHLFKKIGVIMDGFNLTLRVSGYDDYIAVDITDDNGYIISTPVYLSQGKGGTIDAQTSVLGHWRDCKLFWAAKNVGVLFEHNLETKYFDPEALLNSKLFKLPL